MNINHKIRYTNEDFFHVIGKISVVFATLDFIITQLLFRLTSVKDYDSLGINDNTTLGSKLRKLRDLQEYRVNYPQILRDLNDILSEAIELADERNRYIHDQWVFNDDKIINGRIDRCRIKRKSKFNVNCSDYEKKSFEIGELVEFCDKVIDLQNKVMIILNKIPPFNIDNINIKNIIL